MKQTLLGKLWNLGALALVLSASSCEVDTFVPFPEAGGPAGVITGSVTYSGPLPCTEDGFIVGAAVLLAFEENLLPPPEGLGTAPASLNIVTGEVMFSGVRDQLTFNEDGSRWCPGAGTNVVVSADYALSPLAAGVYQIRGYYDLDGDFNPSFGIFSLPSAGDIGGGAIENTIEALQGAPVQYRAVGIGELQEDGSRVIPPVGFRVDGVSVSYGLPLPFERPVFHARAVLDDTFGNTDPNNIVIPADYLLNVFDVADPGGTESSFIRIVLGAGMQDADEQQLSQGSPFNFSSAPQLFMSRQDVNGDGVIDMQDSIPETELVPALLPQSVMSKLQTGNDLDSQVGPSVVLQNVTLLDGLLQTVTAPIDLAELRDEVVIALRPAVLCLDVAALGSEAVLVNTHPTDGQGNILVADEAALEASLSEQFLRPVRVEYGCLPQGRYAINLIYDTGQAWTVPNEARICLPGEPANSDNTVCGTRPRLASQSVVVTIGPPVDEQYCIDNPTPPECLPAATP